MRARAYFLDAVAEGRLKPGDEVDRREAATAIGISLAPVNQAVSQLEREGLFEIRARRDTRVRQLDERSTAGCLLVREALEMQAARLYAGEPIRRARSTLLAEAHALDARGPERAKVHADVAFHRRLVRLTGVPPLGRKGVGSL